jgi:hypothetical protein
VLHGLLPLNLGYRLRHRAFGTLEKGRGFEELRARGAA